MAEFFDILPPPQSIDALDAWGVLDALPASLDDGFWTRAGVYGLSASEKARAGQSFSALRKRCVGLSDKSAGAASRQTLVFLRVRGDALKEGARASGSVQAERERPLSVRGAAESAAGMAFARLRDGRAAFSAVSSQGAKALRVRVSGLSQGLGEAAAAFFAVAELALSGEGEAVAGERATLARVRLVDGPASPARASGSVQAERERSLSVRGAAESAAGMAFVRTRDGSAAFSAVSSQEAKALRVRVSGLSQGLGEAAASFFAVAELALSGEGEAVAGERAALARVRLVDGPALSARAGGNAAFFRFLRLAARDGAPGSSLFTLFRVKPVVPEEAGGRAFGGMAIMRLVGLACPGDAFGKGSALLVRVLALSGTGSARGVGSVFPEYKGWTWARRDDVPETLWQRMPEDEALWRPRPGGSAVWQEVVEWQQA